MKIIKRLAEEQFCFSEIHFDSLEEYQDGYPKFIQAYKELKAKNKTQEQKVADGTIPFQNNLHTNN